MSQFLERRISGNLLADKQTMLNAAQRSQRKYTLQHGQVNQQLKNGCRSIDKSLSYHARGHRSNLVKEVRTRLPKESVIQIDPNADEGHDKEPVKNDTTEGKKSTFHEDFGSGCSCTLKQNTDELKPKPTKIPVTNGDINTKNTTEKLSTKSKDFLLRRTTSKSAPVFEKKPSPQASVRSLSLSSRVKNHPTKLECRPTEKPQPTNEHALRPQPKPNTLRRAVRPWAILQVVNPKAYTPVDPLKTGCFYIDCVKGQQDQQQLYTKENAKPLSSKNHIQCEALNVFHPSTTQKSSSEGPASYSRYHSSRQGSIRSIARWILTSNRGGIRLLRRNVRGFGCVAHQTSAVAERVRLNQLKSTNLANLQLSLQHCPFAIAELCRLTLDDRMAFQGLTTLVISNTSVSQDDIMTILRQLAYLQIFSVDATLDNGNCPKVSNIDIGACVSLPDIDSCAASSIVDESQAPAGKTTTTSNGSITSGSIGHSSAANSTPATTVTNVSSASSRRRHSTMKLALVELSLNLTAVNGSVLENEFLTSLLQGATKDLKKLKINACGFAITVTEQFSRAVNSLKVVEVIHLANNLHHYNKSSEIGTLNLSPQQCSSLLSVLTLDGIGLTISNGTVSHGHLRNMDRTVQLPIEDLCLRGMAGVTTNMTEIAPHVSRLRSFAVEYCQKLSIPGLINILQRTPKLTKLSLHGSAVTDYIAHAIADTRPVEDINVGLSYITDEGLRMLAIDGVKTLRCYGCVVSTRTIEEFSKVKRPRIIHWI